MPGRACAGRRPPQPTSMACKRPRGIEMASRFSAVSTAVLACLAAGAATAADSGASDPTDAGFRLQEVVVTAEKVTSLAQQTPLALSVVSGSALQQSGVFSVADLQNVL